MQPRSSIGRVLSTNVGNVAFLEKAKGVTVQIKSKSSNPRPPFKLPNVRGRLGSVGRRRRGHQHQRGRHLQKDFSTVGRQRADILVALGKLCNSQREFLFKDKDRHSRGKMALDLLLKYLPVQKTQCPDRAIQIS